MDYSLDLKSRSPTKVKRAKSKLKPLKTSKPQAEYPSLSQKAGKQFRLFKRLDDYQQKAVIFSAGLVGSALFFEQRTGKTWISLALAEYVDAETAMFVVPLNNLDSTWATTISLQLPQYKICRNWEEFSKAKGYRILLINYEQIRPRRRSKERTKLLKKVQSFNWELVVFDESQRLKARNSSNSRLARRFRTAQRRVILSGTPMDKSPIDVWAQMRFVEPKALGETWSSFSSRFCERAGFMGKQWKFNDDKLPEYLEAIKPYAMRLTKSDIGMVEPIVTVDYVNLLGEQRRLYEHMDKHMVIRTQGTRVKADLTITRNVKLQQITGGFVIDDNDEIIRIGKAKARRLEWRIQHVSLPVVIFCKYIEEIDIIYETIKPYVKGIGIIYGQVKDTKKEKARTNIQSSFQRGELDALICQIRTGGVGIDLFKADSAILYSMGHSWIDYDQARSRIEHRDKDYPTELFLILAKNTIDDDILEAVRSKRSLTQVVLERLKHRRK